MATVVLQYAGLAAGTFLGGPAGGVIGRALGAVAGNIIDQALFGDGPERVTGPRLTDLRVMSSSEGAPVPRLWGRMRVAGEVIWATNFEEVQRTTTESSSGKGGGSAETKVTEFTYFANFALALCEGEIDRIGRMWADGKELDANEFVLRLHTGSETQEPDSLIVAKEGADNAPAYRGIAYVVFERMPVTNFGNRLPQISFEVFRSAGGAAEKVRAVNIIPATTEFGYDTALVTRQPEQGVTEPETLHASGLRSDWSVSLDQLQADCPNVEAASLVVAWFGSDLRCASCTIRPGVEAADKLTDPETWEVGGEPRESAHVVSTSGEGPAFGGTPSDASVIRAIADLKARNLAVVFYPFVMMDIAAGNALPDPYGGTAQGAYPWRGRITCSLAPGQPGTVDGTPACAAEIADFVGLAAPGDFTAAGLTVTYSGPAEWSYRRMVLHYAKLCALAGGVDAFLIGSELRGLTTLRSAPGVYPFVAALTQLAAEVKAILPAAKVSYAADWSEYFGHQPADGSGDVYFHLDPLWASADVDFIGIDNYMPLSDWRDGRQHTDYLAGYTSLYDLSYLTAGIAGGEGHAWYYASSAGREAQARLAITDGAHGKPWVFRYKDILSWWLNAHYDRPGGMEQATPTAWIAQSKPVWFTEAGCPAIDKGTNQPNAFVDAKSSENLVPYFSNGQRDDLIQNRYIQALTDYWSAPGPHNPVSALYGAPMVTAGRIFLWAWDARPFPFFPARADVWSDAVNYDRGHWLNGRIGAVPLGQLITAVCADYGVTAVDAGGVEGLVDGFVIDRVMPARAVLEDLLDAFGIDMVESGGLLRFTMRSRTTSLAVAVDDLVETEPGAELFALTRAQEADLPAALTLTYIESALDYRLAAVEAQRQQGSSLRDMGLSLPCAIDQARAQVRADIRLQETWAARLTAALTLPPSALALEAGDVVSLALPSGPLDLRIEEIGDGGRRRLRARSHDAAIYEPPLAPARVPVLPPVRVFGKPDVVMVDLPIAQGGTLAFAPWLAATARPWPGRLAVYRKTGPQTFTFNRFIDAPAAKGTLLDSLGAGPANVFDRASSFTVKLDRGALFSVEEAELLQGANVAAVGSSTEGYEMLQFASAELLAPRTYRLSVILRGVSGSEPEILASRAAGSRFVLIDGAVVQPELTQAEAGLESHWRVGPAQYDPSRAHVNFTHTPSMVGLRPLSPCQLRARREGGDVVFTWIRRTRIDGDSWDLSEVALGEESEAYRLDILDGSAIKRSESPLTAEYRYTAAAIAADFGADPGEFTLRIAQLSATFGPGAALQRTIHV